MPDLGKSIMLQGSIPWFGTSIKRGKQMMKKTFSQKLIDYIEFFNNYIGEHENFSDNIDYTVGYACRVFENLKLSYIKENKNKLNYKFQQNIFVMKQDLKNTDFESLEEVVNEIIDDLNFLKRKYGGGKWNI